MVSKILKGVLVGAAEDSEVESGAVHARKNEVSVRASDVESSEEGISPIVKSEDKSVVVLEVEDTEGSHGTEDGGIASHLLDFGFLEEEDFDTLGHTGFFADRFH